MVELGIVDIREIIRLINSVYGIDFSNYSLTSFKYRLENVIAKNNLNNPENLFRKLSAQPEFFDKFFHQISVPSSEMFRDPSVWRWLREVYFPSLDDKHLLNFKIWIPYCVSGGELYSLTIMLKEIGMLEKVKIFATSFSEEGIELIKSGEYPYKKIEISSENYRRFQGEHEFSDYYKEEKYRVRRDTSLIKNVEFIKDDINFNNAPKNIKLILLRNVMIYFNPSFQEKLLEKLHEHLSGFGNLIIGLKEKIRVNQNAPDLFEAIEPNEGVYKKRLV